MDKVQIPLTHYKRGVRTEIGMVEVSADGEIKAQVAKDMWPLLKHLFRPNVGELSIGPAPQNSKTAKSTRVATRTTNH